MRIRRIFPAFRTVLILVAARQSAMVISGTDNTSVDVVLSGTMSGAARLFVRLSAD